MNVRRFAVLGAAGLLALAAVTPVVAQAPQDPLGVVEIPAGEPIHVAMWGVLSGANAVLGEDIVRGIEIQIDDHGGKLLGRDIQLTKEDGGCSPEGGATAAQKLAADKTIVGLIGSVCSDETVGGIKTITDAGLTTISPSNTRPLLTDPNRGPEYAGFARTAFNDAVQGKVVAEFVYNGLGLRKAATIHDGSAYAEALQQVFADEFTKMGGQIVIQEAVSAGQSDMKPVLTKVAAAAPEIIYYPIFTAEGAFITAQSKQVPGLEKAALIGSDGLFSSQMVVAAGPAADGMYISAPDYSAMAAGYADFVQKHIAKYGEKPLSAFHAHAYDASAGPQACANNHIQL